MANLRKFTLAHNREKQSWDLENNATGKVVKRYDTKEDATTGGMLKKALGQEGGSVRIEKERGGYQEERTYPKSKDPVKSKG